MGVIGLVSCDITVGVGGGLAGSGDGVLITVGAGVAVTAAAESASADGLAPAEGAVFEAQAPRNTANKSGSHRFIGFCLEQDKR